MPMSVAADRPLRILCAASERGGLAKTGVLPLYRCVSTGPHRLAPTRVGFTTPLGHHSLSGRLWRSTLPESDVPVYLVEQPELFERDDPAHGRGLYQYVAPDGRKHDYADN